MSPSSPVVRDYEPIRDRGWADEAVANAFGGPLQARRGALIDVLALPGLVAELDGEPIALLSYDPSSEADEIELAVLLATVSGAGGGSALVRKLQRRAESRAIWVVTTNDNVDALRFYQRRGFRFREVRAGAVDRARRDLKPGIPERGRHDIPIRDELELVHVRDPAHRAARARPRAP